MANEYLIRKWRSWFKLIDMKHKGNVSKEYIKREEEAYAKATNLEGESKKEFMEFTDKLVDDLIFHGRPGSITEDDFIDMTNDEFKADKDQFVEKMRKILPFDFMTWDPSGRGYVTEDEWLLGFKTFGIDDEAWCRKYFQLFNPDDGKVNTKFYVDIMLPFWVSEDSSVTEPVLEALESVPVK